MRYLFQFIFVLTTFLVFASACDDKASETEDLNTGIRDSTQRFGDINFVFPGLSRQSEEITLRWSVFEDFENEATTLNGKTIQVLRNKTERLIRHTDTLQKNIPDSLNTTPIYSRLVVVGARVKLLHQEVHRASFDSTRVAVYLDETNNAVRNLIVQINEKFLKDAIDLQREEDEQKELEKQKRYLDSIAELELRDQTLIDSVTNR